jgi:putative membrane protein
MDRVVQTLINAAALYVAVMLIGGIEFDFGAEGAWWRFLLVALIFGLVNTFLRPILRILTLPITLMTLGLFLLVINALLLMLTGVISAELDLGFFVDGFLAALLGSIVISIVGFLLSLVIGSSRVAGRVL